MTFEDARPWARSIKTRVSKREMPPWGIDKNVGIQSFKNDISLSDDEIAKIVKWVDDGAPMGNLADMPAPRQFDDPRMWHIGNGKPDLIVSMAKPYKVPAVGADVTLEFVSETGLTEDRYIKEIETKPDGAFRLWQPDGTLDVEGKVVICDPPRKLAVTWRVMWIEEMRKLPECLVTYQIDDLGKVVRLTLTEAHQIDLDDKMLEGGRRGWPVILNNLKTLLETGHPMPEFDFMGDSRQALEEMKDAARKQTGGES